MIDDELTGSVDGSWVETTSDKSSRVCWCDAILKTESLELRRLKFDLNMIYCAIHGVNALDSSNFFRHTMCNSSSRGHSLKIRKQFSRVNCRAFSFANRCVDVWNSLNNEVVFASSLSNFKKKLKNVNFSAFYVIRDDVNCQIF